MRHAQEPEHGVRVLAQLQAERAVGAADTRRGPRRRDGGEDN